ncbi:excitatory amino acid transporter [Aplysia californica]|uniref:Amino acid transporter n=1 Tax=Aplysia californica TaxID=6500 RepID=A0ABM1VRS4_APLCA|nr:excitatory amino acid transporter [Aplysia californica]
MSYFSQSTKADIDQKSPLGTSFWTTTQYKDEIQVKKLRNFSEPSNFTLINVSVQKKSLGTGGGSNILASLIFRNWTTPVGVTSLITVSIAGVDDIADVFRRLGLLVASVTVGLVIYQMVVWPAVIFLFTRRNPFMMLVKCIRPFVIAFAATATAISPILSLAIPPVPSASIVTLVIILTSLNYPLNDVALLFAVEWILDRLRSGVNAIGHVMVAIVVDAICNPRGKGSSAPGIETGRQPRNSSTSSTDFDLVVSNNGQKLDEGSVEYNTEAEKTKL